MERVARENRERERKKTERLTIVLLEQKNAITFKGELAGCCKLALPAESH